MTLAMSEHLWTSLVNSMKQAYLMTHLLSPCQQLGISGTYRTGNDFAVFYPLGSFCLLSKRIWLLFAPFSIKRMEEKLSLASHIVISCM